MTLFPQARLLRKTSLHSQSLLNRLALEDLVVPPKISIVIACMRPSR